jgi:hypothetical protein
LRMIKCIRDIYPEACNAKLLDDGNTFLQSFISRKGKPENIEERKAVLDQLVKWGSSLTVLDKDGRTPLIWAVIHCDLPMVKHIVVKHGVNMKGSDAKGRTAIQWTDICWKRWNEPAPPIDEFFMMSGARPSDFIEGSGTRMWVRDSVYKFYKRIDNTRDVLIAFLGSRKKSAILTRVPRDIMVYLAKLVYQTRGQEIWDPASTRSMKR